MDRVHLVEYETPGGSEHVLRFSLFLLHTAILVVHIHAKDHPSKGLLSLLYRAVCDCRAIKAVKIECHYVVALKEMFDGYFMIN